MNHRSRWTLAIGLLLLWALPSHAATSRYFKQLWYGAVGDTTAVGMADSTAILSTINTGHLFLWLKPDKPCRVAIQVRAHGTADTAGVSLPDTTQAASWSWRGHVGAAGTLSNQADSTVWIENQGLPATPGTTVTATEDEYVVQFGTDAVATTGKAWSGPRAKWIPLARLDSGAPFWAPATTIRIRVMQAASVVTWVGALHGAPW